MTGPPAAETEPVAAVEATEETAPVGSRGAREEGSLGGPICCTAVDGSAVIGEGAVAEGRVGAAVTSTKASGAG